MKFSTIKEFEKDFKHLKKKFPSLDKDIETLKIYGIELFHKDICSLEILPLQGFLNERFVIYKIRTIACASLKNRGKKSGLRLIYAYDIKNEEAIFIELYFKSEKENEDKDRIEKFLSFYNTGDLNKNVK